MENAAGVSQIRHQLPQARVLIAKLLGLLGLAHVHPAILRLPGEIVCFDTPHSRATSSAFRLASSCFSAAIICASVCLLSDINPPLSKYDFIFGYVRFSGSRSE
jgi:hypothetical protein